MEQKKIKAKKHALAVDLESWVFSKKINSLNLSLNELRNLEGGYIHKALDYLLKTLRRHDQKTTFFVVTKLEELYPGIIEKIKKEGHEIGWHSHTHARLDGKKILIEELEAAKNIIKKYNIKGLQAPEVYFFKEGYPILKKYGFIYSSSIYGNSKNIYKFNDIFEIPVSTSRFNYSPSQKDIIFPSSMRPSLILKFGIPFGSSFFWSILGKKYYEKRLKQMQEMNIFANLFIHDWQLIKPSSKEYEKDVSFFWNPFFLPYKVNVSSIFEYLLSNFSFQPIIRFLQ